MCRAAATLVMVCLSGCGGVGKEPAFPEVDFRAKVNDYVPIGLEADLSSLSESQLAMLRLLAEAAEIMDGLSWRQAFGEKDQLLPQIEDPNARRFAEINYGPWDRLGDNEPFLPGFGPKPPGANYCPADMSKDEFESVAEEDPELRSQHALVRRDDSSKLIAVPYHEAFPDELTAASDLLRQAAVMAEDEGFRRYLEMRATALKPTAKDRWIGWSAQQKLRRLHLVTQNSQFVILTEIAAQCPSYRVSNHVSSELVC